MSLRSLLASFLTLGLLAACGRVFPAATSSPLPAVAATETPVPFTPTPRAAPIVLRVWVPPRFDPAFDAQFQARLDAFVDARPGLKIDVRVKEESALLESMRLTALAAPGASPDLVLFSRAELEAAAARGLVVPLEASALEDDGWYEAARALGRVRDEVYGLPFALDALVLVSPATQPVTSWQEVADAGPLLFNLNEARFPLALYLSAGGGLTDAQGEIVLDEAVLTRVLALFAQGEVIAVDEENPVPAQGGFVVGWASGYLLGEQASVRLDALPGLGDSSATLVDGWIWSLASTDVEKQTLALELAVWLTADEFLAGWIPSVGYLPPHTSARWDGLLQTARLVPPAQQMDVVLPNLNEALVSVLGGVSPEAAAHAAVERLK